MVENKDYSSLLKVLDIMKQGVSETVNFPEVAMELDLKSRRDQSENQIFKYLHLQCHIHSQHFIRVQQIKSTYLLEGYLNLLENQNPLAPYIFARSILELVAFNHRVMSELVSIRNKKGTQWKSKGEEYFSFIVRARYGTSYDKQVEILTGEGNKSKNSIKPLNIGECMRSLSGDSKYTKIASGYSELSDYLHHNLSSQLICTEGVTKTDKSINSNGDGIMTNDEMLYTVYKYPVITKSMKAEKDTVNFILECCTALLDVINLIPKSVYSEKELVEYTGNKLGMTVDNPQNKKMNIPYLTGREKIDPYDLCPCGSLKKYKFCCGKKG